MAKVKLNEPALKAALQVLVDELHQLNDPSEINEIRRIFRSSVPLFNRGYVAALLIKKARMVQVSPIQEERRPAAPPRRPEKVVEDIKPSVSRNNEEMTTLFVGIGRTRRVYPRDLMGLLIDTCKLEKEDIGAIKILDNYSFIDIKNEKAQAVIDVINNQEFRGRTLSVNFAKKKE